MCDIYIILGEFLIENIKNQIIIIISVHRLMSKPNNNDKIIIIVHELMNRQYRSYRSIR